MSDSKYEVEINLDEPNNSSYWHLSDMIGSGKRVLDVGCDTGYFGAALARRGNEVVGVEYVEATARVARERLNQVVVADLEAVDLVEEFGAGSFDAVVFADVLEHLRDPVTVLRRARRLLVPGGCVVISVPNIAHGDIRLALLNGRFDYTVTGLLDQTHTRFFTRANVTPFLGMAGFTLADLRRVRVPMFLTEQRVRREDYPVDLVQRLEDDPETDTYQFVFKAVPADAGVVAEELADRAHDLQIRVDWLEDRLTQTTAQLGQTQDQLGHVTGELEQARRAAAQGASARWRQQAAARLPALAAVYRKIRYR